MLRASSLFATLVLVGRLVPLAAVADDDIPVLPGTWSWPDQGLGLWDPNGDSQGGAVVMDMLVHDNALVVVGAFNYAGGVGAQNVAVWRGDPNGEFGGWSPLGDIAPSNTVYAIASGGGAIYIGGLFNNIGPLSAKGVAKWDGATWSVLGLGPGAPVRALAWWDDGTGATLYAGGSFPQRLKKWNGASWVAVGGGCSAAVYDLTVYDFLDGNGSALYAAGDFSVCGAGGNNVAKWDGLTWSSLGLGVTDGSAWVNAVVGFDDGSGPALYIGGSFDEVDGKPILNIARWDGKTWSAVGNPDLQYFETIEALRVLDDDGPGPNAPALFAIGGSTLQKWNGQTWIRYQQQGALLAAEVFPDENGNPRLHVGGEISFFAGKPPVRIRKNIARWDGPTSFGCKSADFDGNGHIDQADLGILLAAFNCPGPGCQGDADGDGDTDQADLGILLANFGQKCG